MARVRGAHASLRFDVPADQLAAYCAALVTILHLDLLTTTESRSRALVKALRKHLGRDYRVVRRHEYLHVWRRATFRATADGHLAVLSPVAYWMMGKLGRRFLAASQRLRHRSTGRLVRSMVAHAPSGIEGKAGAWRIGALAGRLTSARQGFHRWGKRITRWQRGDRVQLASMDGNLDQRNARWLNYLTSELGGTSVWRDHHPDHGTHGARVIDTMHVIGDGVVIRGCTVVSGKRVPKPKGLDHDPILWVIDL